MGKLNPLRFSTKYQDGETDLLYYGKRYLNTSTGRWLSRDPIEEQGGDNVYVFSLNCAISHCDILGEQAASLWTENCCAVNRPETTDARFCCCEDKKVAEGRKILEERWLAAVNYLNPKGPIPNPKGVGGISCVASANGILAFMRPIPPCWKCFIQRRWWNYNPLAGDENSILCQSATRYTYGYGRGQGWRSEVVFDWWYPLYVNYHKKPKPSMPYKPMSPGRYNWSFPWAMPDLNGEWTESNPADYNTCLGGPDRRIRPMDYTHLDPLLPPYPTTE